MRRKHKLKKVRELHEVYSRTSDKQDAVPPTLDWEQEFAQEKTKREEREKRDARRIESQRRKRKEKLDSGEISGLLTIKPRESLRDFNDRVENEARLEASAKARAATNKKQKEKFKARKETKRLKVEEDEPKRFKSSMPSFLHVVDRPPEFQTNKERFAQLASEPATNQMESFHSRVQTMYENQKKKKTKRRF